MRRTSALLLATAALAMSAAPARAQAASAAEPRPRRRVDESLPREARWDGTPKPTRAECARMLGTTVEALDESEQAMRDAEAKRQRRRDRNVRNIKD